MASHRLPDEFELIARYFAPLASDSPGALALADDAGLIAPAPGCDHVVTTDALIGGVHFLPDDPADLVARKLLRVNLSDLAAMGARPAAYLLAASFPESTDADWVAAFARGLAADQREFGLSMLGGDTTATRGPPVFTATAIGEVPMGQELRRSTARAGDIVYVSGTVGDAALGLRALQGADGGTVAGNEALIDRYRLPRPRMALGLALRGVATAATDLSDGLLSDLGNVCRASGVGGRIRAEHVPLSPAVHASLVRDASLMGPILTGGDDYELLFTADRRAADAVAAAGRRSGVEVTAIGHVEAGAGVAVLDPAGRTLDASGGYRHF